MKIQLLSHLTSVELDELKTGLGSDSLTQGWRIDSSDELNDVFTAKSSSLVVYFISRADDQNFELKGAVEGLDGDIRVFRDIPDLLRELSLVGQDERRSIEVPKIQQRADESVWWLLNFGLTYVLVGGWLRYFDTEWRLPLFDFRGVIYRPYLQLHLPTLGGIIFFLICLGLRRRSKSRHLLRLPYLIFNGATLAYFTFLFFRHGFILNRKQEVHAEGLQMLTRFEPFRPIYFLFDDPYRYYLNTGFSPNIWPFWQPWLIVLTVGGGWVLLLRWILSKRASRRWKPF